MLRRKLILFVCFVLSFVVLFACPACEGEEQIRTSCFLHDNNPEDKNIEIMFLEDEQLGGACRNICRCSPGTVLAKIVIHLHGVEQVEGIRIEGEDFIERVSFECPSDEELPSFEGNFCEIREGGDVAGEKLVGKWAIAFDNGYFISATFECALEAAGVKTPH